MINRPNVKFSLWDTKIVLPDDIDCLAELESKLSDDVLRSLSRNVRQDEVEVILPKFKFNKSYSLVDCLKQMGISDLFQ